MILYALCGALLAADPAPASATPRGVLYDFTATWCGPCQQMSPLVSRLEREGLPVQRVDVDRNRDLARRHRVEGIPAFVLVVDGQEVERVVGATSEQTLRRMLARIPKTPRPAPAPSVAAVGHSAVPTGSGGAPAAQASAPKGTAPIALPVTGSVATRADDPSRLPEPRARLGAIPGSSASFDDPDDSFAPAPAGLSRPSTSAPKRALAGTGGSVPFGGPAGRGGPAAPVVRANLDDEPADASPAAAGPRARDPLEASVRLRVLDKRGTNFGSGTVIDSRVGRTVILTCGHVLKDMDDTSRIEVDVFRGAKHETFVAKVLAADQEADVGLVVLPTTHPFPVASLAPRDLAVAVGAHVFGVGCSGGEVPTKQQLLVTAVNRYLGPDNLECTGVPVQGRSGGGLFDKHGDIVGVCVAADPREKRGLYAGLEAAWTLLERAGLASPAPKSTVAPSVAANEAPASTATAEFDPDAPIGGPPARAAGIDAEDDFRAQDDDERFAAPPARNGSATGHPDRAFAAAPRSATSPKPAVSPASHPAEDFSAESTAERAQLVADALKQAGEAEVICIIRSHSDPRAASRVVIINRASPKFVNYLSGEMASQPVPTAARRLALPEGSAEPDDRSNPEVGPDPFVPPLPRPAPVPQPEPDEFFEPVAPVRPLRNTFAPPASQPSRAGTPPRTGLDTTGTRSPFLPVGTDRAGERSDDESRLRRAFSANGSDLAPGARRFVRTATAN